MIQHPARDTRADTTPAGAPTAPTGPASVPVDRLPAVAPGRPSTLPAILAAAVAESPDVVAVVQGGVSLTFADLHEHAELLARHLVALGVHPGDVVTSMLPNWWEAAVALYGVQLAGAVYHTIEPQVAAAADLYGTGTSSRVVLVPQGRCGDDLLDATVGAIRDRDLDVVVMVVRPTRPLPAASVAFPAAGSTAPAVGLPGAPDPDAVAVVLHSSGTTGPPKGSLHSHRGLLHEVRQVAAVTRLGSSDVVLTPSPVRHITGMLFGTIMPVDLQVTSVLLARWDAERAVDLSWQHQTTFCIASTPFLLDMVRVHEARRTSSPLEVYLCGGAAIGRHVVERAEAVMGTRVVRCYGTSEVPTFSIGDPYGDPERAASTDGVVVPGATWRTDPDTGELLIRSPEQCVGFLREATAAAYLTEDGFVRTGDIVEIVDGHATHLARATERVARRGALLRTADLEDLLLQVPGVVDAALVTVPGPAGDECVATVVCAPGGTVDVDALGSALEQRGVAPVEVPDRFVATSAIPRTPSGKVVLTALREQLGAVPA